MWAILAKYNNANTKEIITAIRKKLTQKQIAKVKNMAGICLDSKYKNCD